MAAGSTYTPIATTTLGSAATSYTFTSIPSTYTDLVLVGNLSSSSNTNISIRINSDSGTNYSNTYLTGVNGTGASSARGVNSTAGAATWTGASMNSSVSTLLVNFMNYSNTTTYKTFNQFAIKIVLSSLDSTRTPIIHDLRVLALPSGA